MKTLRLIVYLILILEICTGIAEADFVFGEPTKVPNLSGLNSDCSPQISRDGLELYFNYDAISGGCSYDIWVSKRLNTEDPWPAPVKLEIPVNSPGPERTPSLSADGLELYFSDGFPNVTGCTPNPNGHGHTDLWVSTRISKDDPWGEPMNLGPTVNTENAEDTPCISADGLELYFMSNVPGDPKNSEILVAIRPTKDDPWGEPVILGPNVNSSQYEYTPFISADGLSLFFSRGYSKAHIFVSRRASKTDTWGPAELFTPVNSGKANDVWGTSPGSTEFCVSFAQGDPRIYFTRGTTVFTYDYDIWQVEATPIVDLDGDGKVDCTDVCIMTEFWGTSEPLCDIAPPPLGDGVVDVQDLIVLSEHLFEGM